jgi:predicted phage gp36 major capsid-like protein
VAETAARPQTATPTLAELTFPAMELYAMPAATASLLEDAAVDLDQWIAEEVETAFAEQEGAAFVSGNGTNKPTRLPRLRHGGRSELELGQSRLHRHRRRRRAAGQQPVGHADRPRLRAEGGLPAERHFVMNRKTQAAIRKLKDADGNYLWQPPAAGGRAMLMGFPVVEAEDMPDIAATDATLDRLRRLQPRLPGGRPHRACACCAIRIRPSPTCCSTRRSASAAACRTSTRSSW